MNHWPNRSLGELCDVVSRRAVEGTRPYLEIGNLSPITKEYRYSDKPAVKGALTGETGDLIVSRVRPTRGAITLLRERDLAVSSAFTILRPKSAVDSRFLFFALAWNKEFLAYLGRRSKGALYPTVPEKDVLAFEVPVPPAAEQKRIVMLLDKAHELQKMRAEADLRSADLFAALFEEMFGEMNTANARWPIVPIKSMGTVVTGNTPPRKNPEFYGTFIEWVKTDNIRPTSRVVGKATEMLSEQGAARGRIVPAGSVLVTCIAGSRGRIGDAAVTDRQVAINQQINAIVPKAVTDSAFLCELVRAIKPVIQSRATGVMTGIIKKSALEEIQVARPPFTLQKKFGVLASEIHELTVAQLASHARLDGLFQSMLHRAFSGEL